ncbi:MAG: four helix bundle protein [Acidobacteria bacterium]|nr:four helix bundle protein [Acidobacteriota bacterium]
MTISRFEDIEAWKKSRDVTKDVYEFTKLDGFNKDFALRDQIRRAVISIMSNIAEGFERGGDKEFVQFLSVAKGSCGEARAQLYVAFDQAYISHDEFSVTVEKLTEIGRMISGLMKYLKQSTLKGNKFK